MDPSGGYQGYPFVSDFYDSVSPYGSRRDVAFYVDLAGESGGPVLELGCGTGRVLIPTARAGVSIVGLDVTPEMLETCRRKLEKEPEEVRSRVELVRGDMRDFALGRRFSLVTTPFRPFQHIETVDDQLACLRSAHRHLEDGGRFVLDVFNPSLDYLVKEKYLEEFASEPEIILDDGRRVVRKHRLTSRDTLRQILHCQIIYDVTHAGGRRERLVHAFNMRYLFRYEAEHLLVRAGFTIEALYADYDKSPYGSKTPGDLIFVARKV
jgi:SAM-dependent methyltransferase